jgi:hypothetical protein
MKHRETRFRAAQPSAGRFFCPETRPLTLPSPLRGEGKVPPAIHGKEGEGSP